MEFVIKMRVSFRVLVAWRIDSNYRIEHFRKTAQPVRSVDKKNLRAEITKILNKNTHKSIDL